MQYGNFNGCRRQFLLRYFNEEYKQINCGNCDGCVAQTPVAQVQTRLYEKISRLLKTKRLSIY